MSDIKLQNIRKTYTNIVESVNMADSVRSLFEAASAGELAKALTDVSKVLMNTEYTLIGGLAIGYHTRPRGTDDVDILLIDEESVDNVQDILTRSGLFKRARRHAAIHKQTGVEVEILSAPFLKQPEYLVIDTIQKCLKVNFNGSILHVATAKHLVAMKLKRFSAQDKADIQAFIKQGIDTIDDIIHEKELLDKFEHMKMEAYNDKPLEDTE